MPQAPTRYGRLFYAGLLEALVRIMGTAKGYLFHHGPRVAIIAQRLGRSLDLSDRELGELFFGAILADLGMIGLVEDAWENPVSILPPEARQQVTHHPARSADAVSVIPFLETVEPLIRHHHEWWDGSGYPDGLSHGEIPIGAQILRLADTVAALGETRPQRPARGIAEIREVVEAAIGTEFAPAAAREMLSLLKHEGVPPMEASLFRQVQIEAVEHLLPADVSPLSGDSLLEIFGHLIDAKDPYTGGHSRRVAMLAEILAGEMRLDAGIASKVRAAGHLHDLGKLQVPLRLLTKDGALEIAERREVEQHTQAGAQILEGIPSLKELAPGCRYHHERWDGTGYPEGLSKDRIPLLGQLLSVCDSYDAMTSARAYRPAVPHEAAIKEIEEGSGGQFGPSVANAFLELPASSFEAVRGSTAAMEREMFRVQRPSSRRRGGKKVQATSTPPS